MPPVRLAVDLENRIEFVDQALSTADSNGRRPRIKSGQKILQIAVNRHETVGKLRRREFNAVRFGGLFHTAIRPDADPNIIAFDPRAWIMSKPGTFA
jgi:hypothetical protein